MKEEIEKLEEMGFIVDVEAGVAHIARRFAMARPWLSSFAVQTSASPCIHQLDGGRVFVLNQRLRMTRVPTGKLRAKCSSRASSVTDRIRRRSPFRIRFSRSPILASMLISTAVTPTRSAGIALVRVDVLRSHARPAQARPQRSGARVPHGEPVEAPWFSR